MGREDARRKSRPCRSHYFSEAEGRQTRAPQWVSGKAVYQSGDFRPALAHSNPKEPLPFAGLGSQKNYMSLYMMMAYGWPGMADWLKGEFAARGKKLGKRNMCLGDHDGCAGRGSGSDVFGNRLHDSHGVVDGCCGSHLL